MQVMPVSLCIFCAARLIGVRASSICCAKQKCYASHACGRLYRSDVTFSGDTFHSILANSTVGHGERRGNLNQTPPAKTNLECMCSNHKLSKNNACWPATGASCQRFCAWSRAIPMTLLPQILLDVSKGWKWGQFGIPLRMMRYSHVPCPNHMLVALM